MTHAYRVVKRFGVPIRTNSDADRFLAWMKAEGLAASCPSTGKIKGMNAYLNGESQGQAKTYPETGY